MNTFIGVDLGWYGKPSVLASLTFDGVALHLRKIARVESVDEIFAWIEAEAGQESAVAAVDAPLVIPNLTGIRTAEREMNRDYRRFHAGCHAANLGRPFAANVISFSRRLASLGFSHGAGFSHGVAATARPEGRFQIEIHPHAATVSLFGLDRIVKYKRGTREERARGLRRLRLLMMKRLPTLEPSLSLRLPSVPATGNTKPLEDRIDAVMAAYIGAYWWYWGTQGNRVYGNAAEG